MNTDQIWLHNLKLYTGQKALVKIIKYGPGRVRNKSNMDQKVLENDNKHGQKVRQFRSKYGIERASYNYKLKMDQKGLGNSKIL